MAPKSILCYICGRPYLAPSINIHIPQCIELFEKRESMKPKKERRRLPPNPALFEQNTTKLSSSSGVGSTPKNTVSKAYLSDEILSGPPVLEAYGLAPCPHCGRKFNDLAYERHIKICQKVFMQKRTPYDSAAARTRGTEIDENKLKPQKRFQNKQRASTSVPEKKILSASQSFEKVSTNKQSAPTSKSLIQSSLKPISSIIKSDQIAFNESVPKWQLKSNQFREAIRQAREISRIEKLSKQSGIPLNQLLPAAPVSSGPPPDYIQCPFCERYFSETAGSRHIPQCQNIINKPKFLQRGGAQLPSKVKETPKLTSKTLPLQKLSDENFQLPKITPKGSKDSISPQLSAASGPDSARPHTGQATRGRQNTTDSDSAFSSANSKSRAPSGFRR